MGQLQRGEGGPRRGRVPADHVNRCAPFSIESAARGAPSVLMVGVYKQWVDRSEAAAWAVRNHCDTATKSTDSAAQITGTVGIKLRSSASADWRFLAAG